MKIQLKVIALFCLLSAFLSCDNDDNEPRPCPGPSQRKVDWRLPDYMFANGSTWIYQNTIDSTFDSVVQNSMVKSIETYINSSGTANMTGGCPSYVEEESFTAFFESSVNGAFQEGFYRTHISRSILVGTSMYVCDLQVGATDHNATLEAVHGSYTVAGHTYSSVIQMLSRPQTISYAHRFYLCPDVGVIKEEVVNGSSLIANWELVSSAVTPYPYQ